MVEVRSPLITDGNVATYFEQLLERAVSNQQLALNETTHAYLVGILLSFIKPTKRVGDHEIDPLDHPLALILAKVYEATPSQQLKLLQTLGDAALFISGFFPDSLKRQTVDIDYYIAMGESAYHTISTRSRNEQFFSLFRELSRKFTKLVDLFNEVAEDTRSKSDRDLLRLYDVWAKTKSARSERLLRERGIVLSPSPRNDYLQ